MNAEKTSPRLAYARLHIAISGMMNEILSLKQSPHWQRIPKHLQNIVEDLQDLVEELETTAAETWDWTSSEIQIATEGG